MIEDDSHTFFEYSTFKVPYEKLNQTFRNMHKDIEKSTLRVRSATAAMRTKVKQQGNETVPAAPVAESLSELRECVAGVRETLMHSIAEQRALLATMKTRAAQLEAEKAKPETNLHSWHGNRQRTDRLVIAYLLRSGRIETATALAKRTGMTDFVDIDVFSKARAVATSLMKRETTPCLEWINLHRSRLKRNNSILEAHIRIQIVIEMCREGKREPALQYAKKYLAVRRPSPISMLPAEEDVLQCWCIIFTGVDNKNPRYRALLKEDRWKFLAKLFRAEFVKLYNLPPQSAFSMCLQCGLSAYKSPECTPGGNEKCVTCHPSTYALAEGLPHSQIGQSVLHCSYSGEPLNEDNPPWMLPNGRVYGEKTIDRHTERGIVRTPRGEKEYRRSECVRIYIL